jgi:hypothetical protein
MENERTAATATPGIYFHGSRQWGLTEFKSEAELGIGESYGIYFTRNRAYAEAYSKRDGAVYEVELRTQRALRLTGLYPQAHCLSAQDYWRLRAAGFDCVVGWLSRAINETIVLDPSCIRIRRTLPHRGRKVPTPIDVSYAQVAHVYRRVMEEFGEPNAAA